MKSTLFILGLIVLAVFSRLIPHPPNFTAVGAAALLAGSRLGSKTWALVVPITAMFVSDLFLGWHGTMLFTYTAMAIVVLIGRHLNPQSWLGVGASALSSSLVFFVVSNFGVWFLGGGYPATTEGLLECYLMAIPFLGWQLGGDLFYSALLLRLAPRSAGVQALSRVQA
ncbi:MAG: hypothetical protein N2578_03390 [Bdellovibrionaceae bacterium]|nr:hypothetical protein [Pseudobdellovibrionaceae bacterium]